MTIGNFRRSKIEHRHKRSCLFERRYSHYLEGNTSQLVLQHGCSGYQRFETSVITVNGTRGRERWTLNRENEILVVVPPRKSDDWLENSQTCAFNLEARSALEFSHCILSDVCTCNFLYVRVFSCVREFVVKVLFRAEYCSRSTIHCYTIPLVNWSKVAAAVFARQTRLFVVSCSCFKISRSSFLFFFTACD